MGELIQLGRHQLWCGDVKDAPFPKVDIALTDPPFEMSASSIIAIVRKFSDIFVIAGHGVNYHQLCTHKGIKYHFETISIRSKPQSTPHRNTPQILHWNNAFLTTGCSHSFDISLASGGYFPSVFEYKNTQSGNYGKPLEWALRILTMCHATTIVDCFGGTGTVLMACEKLGKTCYIAENSLKMCDLIIQRFNQ